MASTDIQDIIGTTADAIQRALESDLRDAVSDVLDHVQEEAEESVDATAEGDEYADGIADTDEDETTWSAEDVHAIAAEAFEAGVARAWEALREAIESARYDGIYRPTVVVVGSTQ